MRKKRKFLRLKIFAWFAVFFASLSAYYFYIAAPTARAAAAAEISAELSSVVNDGAYRALKDFGADGLLKILRDSDGNITLVQTDAAAVNRIARAIVKRVEEGLGVVRPAITLRLGDFSGISPLFGFGPELKIKTRASDSVSCKYKTVFTESGNQTLHKLYLTVAAESVLILPAEKKPIRVECDVLIAESVIVGRVPAAYLNGGETAEVINLIP
jgi:sporulation protein YunB